MAATALADVPATAQTAAAPQPAAAAQSRLNPTGRVITMPVPLKDGGTLLGEVPVRITPGDQVLVAKAALAEKVGGLLAKEDLARLQAVGDASGFAALAELAAAGFDVRFDPGLLELSFAPRGDQRPVGELSLAAPHVHANSANAARPALMSAYLNVQAGIDYAWDSPYRDRGYDGARLDLTAVARLSGLVLENEMTYEAHGDSDRDGFGRTLYRFQQDGLKRRGTRAVYDLADNMVRIQAGDTITSGTTFQTSPDVLGIAIEKSPGKLRPGQNIRPTGRSSFRIERPADVDVLVNGAIVQRLRLRPGSYNLSELPLRTGANEVQLVITDDVGERRALSFTTFFDQKLLAPGMSEWVLTGGVPSYFKDSEVTYRDGEWYASGFYRQGLSDTITGEAHLQADAVAWMGGLGAFWQTTLGFFAVNGAASTHAERGAGAAVGFDWDLVNFTGAISDREALRFSAEYRSRDFSTAGEQVSYAEIALKDPRYAFYNPYRLRFAASYTFPLAERVMATLSARYQLSDSDLIEASLAPYQVTGDRYGLDLTISAPLSPSASVSVTAGYSNEAYQRLDTFDRDDAGEFRAAVRLFIRPDEASRVAIGYDTLNGRSYASAYRSEGRGLDRWDASVDVQHEQGVEKAGASGAIGYTGARGEARLSHTTAFDGVGYGRLDARPGDQRTSLRVGSALAFADGHLGIGPPIRANGFAIVVPHESIAGREVTVGDKADVRGRSGWLGNAVVADIPAYTATALPVDVADLPIGYSLGTGVFELYAPYRAGYALEVGSSYSVSAYGTLLAADGDPVSLLTGVARPADGSARRVDVFTNAAGRFGAEGLAPGRWIIEMATEPAPTRFIIDVPRGTEGLFKAGTLRPAAIN